MDNEQLKKRLDNAEKEKDEAKADYDDAKSKFKVWKQSRPNLSWNDPEFIYYQQEVNRLGDIYKISKQNYDTLLQKISNPTIPMHVKENECSISQAGSTFLRSIFSIYNIVGKSTKFAISQDLSAINTEPFEWLSSVENSTENRTNYLKYIKDNVLADIVEYPVNAFDAAAEPTLLNTDLGGQPVKGSCDIMLSSCDTTHFKLEACHVVIELKKTVKPKDFIQAKLQLLCADNLSTYSVIVVLTDLKDDWYFYWIEEPDKKNKKSTAILYSTMVTRDLAIGYLRYHLKWVAKRRLKEDTTFNFDFSDPFDDEDDCKDDDVEEQSRKKQKLIKDKRPTFLGTKYASCYISKHGEDDNNLSMEEARALAIENFISKYREDLKDMIVEKEETVEIPDNSATVSKWLGTLPISDKETSLAKQESSATVV
ncbi:hypothetical protein HDV04_001937 [Boothiomyces sp. JEL0838]|nr:hypothetical protein HDV04_001937 [Boothiomyces sp. JEL0838]